MGKLFLGNNNKRDEVILPKVQVVLPEEKIEINLPFIQENPIEYAEIFQVQPLPIEKIIYVDRPIEEIKYITIEVEKLVEVIKEIPIEIIKEVEIIKERLVEIEKPIEIFKERIIEIEKQIFKVPSWSWIVMAAEAAVIILLLLLK